jgi:hypothetical protein
MDYDMGNILLYDEAFTARPLSRCLRAAFRHLYESHQHVVTEIDSICTRFDKIINIRNDIVHGQTVWYSSVEVDEDDRDYISRQLAEVGAKRKVGRTGIVIR